MNRLHKLIAESKKLCAANPELKIKHGLNNSGFKIILRFVFSEVVGLAALGEPLGIDTIRLYSIVHHKMLHPCAKTFNKFKVHVVKERILRMRITPVVGRVVGLPFIIRGEIFECEPNTIFIDEMNDFENNGARRLVGQAVLKGRISRDAFEALDHEIAISPKPNPPPFWANDWRKKGKRK